MTISPDRKCIFITGAASGIGLATARLFAEKGWFIGGYDINENGLKELLTELGDENCITAVLDVSDREQYTAAMNQFSSTTGGRLDLLFNNAGVGAPAMFHEQSFEELMRPININLVGTINGIHLGIDLLKATDNSLCLSTASASAIFGLPGLATYSATKHGIRGLTESLSIELEHLGVRVASVLPGVTDTPILGEEGRAAAATEGPFRLIPPTDVANVVWAAYNDESQKLHWFMPEDLAELDKASALDPEATRDQIAAQGVTDQAIKQITTQKQKRLGKHQAFLFGLGCNVNQTHNQQ